MSKKMWNRAISVVTVVMFLVSGFCLPGTAVQAAPAKTEPVVDVGSINVPSHLGSVASVHEAPGAEKMVVHIQDAHCNYSAQKNVQGILEGLSANNNVRLVGKEGAQSWVNTAILNAIPGDSRRSEMIDGLLDKALIDGSTAFAGNQGEIEALLYGVESKDLYLANLKCYADLTAGRKEALGQISNVKDGLNALKSHMLNEKLLTLIDKKEAYEKRDISFSQYLADLAAIAKENGIALIDSPNIQVAVESAAMEDGIDFAKVNEERTELINDLSKTLVKEDLQNLVTASLQFRTGKIGSLAYYSYLETVIPKDRKCDDLRNYIKYVKLNDQLDSAKLSDERRMLEDKLVKALTKSEDETKLLALIESVNLVEKLVSIKLIREEYNELLSRNVSLQGILAFLYENSKKFSTGFSWNGQPAVWENTYKAGVAFYNAALQREEVFIDNLVKRMDGDNTKVAALISGGFHTSRLEEIMAAKNISYVVVRPRVTERTPEGLYAGIMSELASSMLSAHTTAPWDTLDEAGRRARLLEELGLDELQQQTVGQRMDEGGIALADMDEAAARAKMEELKQGFQLLFKAVEREVSDEITAAISAKADELYKALQNKAVEMGFSEAIRQIPGDPGILYFNTLTGQLEVSVATLRLLAALVLNNQITAEQASLVFGAILGEESDHMTGERAANPIDEEIRAGSNNIARLQAETNRPALDLLIALANGSYNNDTLRGTYGISYEADDTYTAYLVAIRDNNNPEAMVEPMVRGRISSLAETSIPVAGPNHFSVVNADLGDAHTVAAATGEVVKESTVGVPGVVAESLRLQGASSLVVDHGVPEQAVTAAVVGEALPADVRQDVVPAPGDELESRIVLTQVSTVDNVNAARDAAVVDVELEQMINPANTVRILVPVAPIDTADENAMAFLRLNLERLNARDNVSFQFVGADYNEVAEDDAVRTALAAFHTSGAAAEGAMTVRLVNPAEVEAVNVPVSAGIANMFADAVTGRELIVAAVAGTAYVSEGRIQAAEIARNERIQALLRSMYQPGAQLTEANITAIFENPWLLMEIISTIPITMFNLNAYSIMRMMTSVAA